MSVKLTAIADLSHSYIKEAERKMNEATDAFNLACTKVKEKKPVHEEIAKERHAAMYSIILSAFTLEAHINMKGHDLLTPDVWEEYKQKSIKEKWLLFPLFIKGRTFDINDQLFKNFKDVIRWRNNLVHYKNYKSKPMISHPSGGGKVPEIYEITNEKNARFAFETATQMIQELEKLLK
jgi:hypothetical protein